MPPRRTSQGGSRYLYEPFEFASVTRIEAHEKIVETQLRSIETHFQRLEAAVERLEKRMWMAVYGVAGVVLAELGKVILQLNPGG